MSWFRSFGARLSLALVLVVAIALGIVYAIVVPRLERNLVQARLDQLTRSAFAEGQRFPFPRSFELSQADYEFELEAYQQEAANATNARVSIYDDPLALGEKDPENGARTPLQAAQERLVVRAALADRAQRGILLRGNDRVAAVAYPVLGVFGDVKVVLFVAPLDETLANVKLVQRRVVVAGVFALVVAALLGYATAILFARRIRRLERAAERIAGGRLDEPVHDNGRDELGQLAQAFERMRQQLAQLEHARREFIANASHELRTPIFSLGGFLELLSDEELDDATRAEFLATMQEQIDRLTKLATDLLDLSRLDAGRISVERVHVDLQATAETLAEEFAAVARTNEHALEAEGREAIALGDEQRVLQIGRVLVENALLHTPPGTTIRVRAGTEAGWASLSVEDDGPGIPTEHLEQIFERFYRVEGERASGSGLGLAIARELAELMGGTIAAESAPGRTRFTLRLAAAARQQRPAVPALAR